MALHRFKQVVACGVMAGCVGAALASDTANHTPKEEQKLQGNLIIMGGAVHPDTADIWERIVSDAGGSGAAIAVIAAAAGDPLSSAKRTMDTLERYGAKPFFVPAAPRLKGSDHRAAAQDPALAARVAASGGVFFNGGDQSRITETLFTAKGERTPLLDGVWAVLRKGGVLAGTSAGAAIMSETMFHEPRGILELLNHGIKPDVDLSKGVGFIGPGVFVDQHLIARGRFARMLPAMRHAGLKLGLGVDENTAIRVQVSTGQAGVLGASGVILVDLRQELAGQRSVPFQAQGVRLSYLERGDGVNARTGEITPSPFKAAGVMLEPFKPGYKPEFDDPKFYPDVLGKNVLSELMANLLDNTAESVQGLAFAAPDAKDADLGFRMTFRKAADTRAWLRIEKGRAHYTVADVVLDVEPIRMPKPLYSTR